MSLASSSGAEVRLRKSLPDDHPIFGACYALVSDLETMDKNYRLENLVMTLRDKISLHLLRRAFRIPMDKKYFYDVAQDLKMQVFEDDYLKDPEAKVLSLCGSILVVDINVGIDKMAVSVSFASEVQSDKEINTILLQNLMDLDAVSFQKNLTYLALLDTSTSLLQADFFHVSAIIKEDLIKIFNEEHKAVPDLRERLMRGCGVRIEERSCLPFTFAFWSDGQENIDANIQVERATPHFYTGQVIVHGSPYGSAMVPKCGSFLLSQENQKAHQVTVSPFIPPISVPILTSANSTQISAMFELRLTNSIVLMEAFATQLLEVVYHGSIPEEVLKQDERSDFAPYAECLISEVMGVDLIQANSEKKDLTKKLDKTWFLVSFKSDVVVRCLKCYKIPFKDPSQFHPILQVLRKQIYLNEIMSSLIGQEENNDFEQICRIVATLTDTELILDINKNFYLKLSLDTVEITSCSKNIDVTQLNQMLQETRSIPKIITQILE